MKKFVSLQKAMLSSLVYEAAALRGLSLEEIVVLCIEPDSEYADLIPWLTTEPITPGRIACCVADATVLAPILEVLPESVPTPLRLPHSRRFCLGGWGRWSAKESGRHIPNLVQCKEPQSPPG